MPPISESADPTLTNVDKHNKQMDQEIREMVSALTNRLSTLQKTGNHHHHDDNEDDDDDRVRVITLAGNNTGATMRGEMEASSDDDETFITYVNNNFQAINNSIMFGGEYNANDPGVHLDISDDYTEDHDHEGRGKKGKRKGRGTSTSRHHHLQQQHQHQHQHHAAEHSDYVDAFDDDGDLNRNKKDH